MVNGQVRSCAQFNDNEIFGYLDKATSLITSTKTTCQTREFSGEYYGIPKDAVTKISLERNEYLNMLDMLSDIVNYVVSKLEKNSDNCCR